ncbi:MAG: putative sulfate exporter family transporter [Hyphomicrobiales bacterium]|nr:putative sulfate exporter family transporter [Hyphomicrobiales bacterium]
MTAAVQTRPFFIPSIAPGVALTAACAALAGFAAHNAPALANYQMILSIALGALIGNLVTLPASAAAGVAFSLRYVLRFSIVLLGLQITWQQAASVGVEGVAIIVVGVLATFVVAIALGRLLRVSPGLSVLIGVGTAICGASAVLAAKAAVRGDDEDAAYAVACVTLFGTIAIFLYPAIGGALDLSARHYGLWSGASIHEVAQVIAAAFQRGPEALEIGTVAKLTRVAMMAPLIILLGEFGWRFGLAARGNGARPPFPWFLVGFLVMMGVASILSLAPGDGTAFGALFSAARGQLPAIKTATTFLLSMAMVAMGLHTNMRHVLREGLAPLALGLLVSLFIGAFSLSATLFLT